MSAVIELGAPGAVATLTSVALAGASQATVEMAVRSDWEKTVGSRGFSTHVSFDGGSIAVLALWSTREAATHHLQHGNERLRSVVQHGAVAIQLLTLQSLRAGRAHVHGDFSLSVSPDTEHPALIASFEPTLRGREALLEYLQAAGTRFKHEVEGWSGAALYLDADGQRVVEYLQFEGLEGLSGSQASPVIHEHQKALNTFGTMRANVYRVIYVGRR